MTDKKVLTLVHTVYDKNTSYEQHFEFIVDLCVKHLCGESVEEMPFHDLLLVVDDNIKKKKDIIPEVLYQIKERCTVKNSTKSSIEVEYTLPDVTDGFTSGTRTVKLRENGFDHIRSSMTIFWSDALSSTYLKDHVKKIDDLLKRKQHLVWFCVFSIVLHGLKNSGEELTKRGIEIKNIKI